VGVDNRTRGRPARDISGVRAGRPEYRHVMFDVGLVSALAVLVTWTFRRALWGPPPRQALRFGVIAAVSAAIQLGFHAAATAAPSTVTVVALVLTGWTGFTLWMVWLSRTAAANRREGPDDDAGGGGGGGGGPGDDPPGGDSPSGGDQGDIDWEQFERDFSQYVERTRETPAPG
jgi:uncharacterized membrane protein YgcG